MDNRLFDKLHESIPQFNPLIAEGLAYHQIKNCEEYINKVLECAIPVLPKEVEYLGFSYATPYEEFRMSLYKDRYDVSESNVYMIKLHFAFKGEEIAPRFLYLPYVERGGILKLKDSIFAISPIITDNALSVSNGTIYMPFNKSKVIFERNIHYYKANGETKSSYIIHSAIHKARETAPVKRSAKMVTTNAHYLFAKYGFFETFKKFAKCEVYTGTSFSEEEYPRDEWVICSPSGIRPSIVKVKDFRASEVKLAIRRDDYNLTTDSMIASFFYIVDHFSDRFSPDTLDLLEWDNPNAWLIILGLIILYSHDDEVIILTRMQAHIASLDRYVDGMVKDWLEEDDIYVNDIYEFLFELIESFTERLIKDGVNTASMYGKKLTTLRYVLIDIIKGIFQMTFDLGSASVKGLSEKDVNSIVRQNLKTTLIFDLSKSHAEVSTISCPGDCLIPKITSLAKMQTDSSKRSSSKATFKMTRSTVLDASIAEVASLTNCPDADPTGRSRLNMYLKLNPKGYIVRNDELRAIINKTQKLIAR